MKPPRTLDGWVEFGLLLAVFWLVLCVVCWLHGWPQP